MFALILAGVTCHAAQVMQTHDTPWHPDQQELAGPITALSAPCLLQSTPSVAVLQIFPKQYLDLMDDPNDGESEAGQQPQAQSPPHSLPEAGQDGQGKAQPFCTHSRAFG